MILCATGCGIGDFHTATFYVQNIPAFQLFNHQRKCT